MRRIILFLLVCAATVTFSQDASVCTEAKCYNSEGDLIIELQFSPESIRWPLHFSLKTVKDDKWILVRYEHHGIIKTVSLAEYRSRTNNPKFCEDGIPMGEPFECKIDHSGQPKLKDTPCSLTGISKEETIIPIGDGTCSKKIIHWTVIDWCLYDSKNGNGDNKDDLFLVKDLVDDTEYYGYHNKYGKVKPDGAYHYEQIIDVGDFKQPVILHEEKMEIGVGSRCTTDVTLTNRAIAQSKCGESIKWTVTLRSKGTQPEILEHTTIGKDSVSVEIKDLEVGVYQVLWRAKDGCNSPQEAKSLITVLDKKAPSIICKGSISVGVGTPEQGVKIWAKDFVKTSLDNCSTSDEITLSFDSVDIQNVLELSCDKYFGENLFNIYATDEVGNQSYCQIKVKLNSDDPECMRSLNLSGTIENEYGAAINSAHLLLEYGNESIPVLTDQRGAFQINREIPLSAVPRLTLQSDMISGKISTTDLVAIQKHVVKYQEIGNKYRLAAADIDSDGTVGPNDVKMLRHYILGIKSYDGIMGNKLLNVASGESGRSISIDSKELIKLVIIQNGDVVQSISH